MQEGGRGVESDRKREDCTHPPPSRTRMNVMPCLHLHLIISWHSTLCTSSFAYSVRALIDVKGNAQYKHCCEMYYKSYNSYWPSIHLTAITHCTHCGCVNTFNSVFPISSQEPFLHGRGWAPTQQVGYAVWAINLTHSHPQLCENDGSNTFLVGPLWFRCYYCVYYRYHRLGGYPKILMQ